MMCSLGSRLQSASVRSGPSRKLRVDTPGSSTLLASISSASGVCKYSSNLFRDFRRAFSRPIGKGQSSKLEVTMVMMR